MTAAAARLAITTALIVSAMRLALPPPAGAPPAGGCEQTDLFGQCDEELPVIVPGSPDGPGQTARPVGTGDGPPGHDPACVWTTVPETSTLRAMFPDAPPDAIFQVLTCDGQDTRYGAGTRWLPPGGSAPSPPTPGALATVVYARVKASMAAPTLGTDPAVGVGSVVNVPVFVEVTNWQSEIADRDCVFGVCVTMTATPSLSFVPGDGSPPISCAPPGSRYEPGGPPLAEQGEGACAHTYRLRTGIDDRPEAWPGVVTVTWDVSWTSTVGPAAGPSGSFDPLTFSTALPRAVDEVATVVVDGET